MFVAQNFIRNLVNKYGKHPVSTDGGTWYPYACKFLKLRHHLHSSFEKNIIEKERENNSIHEKDRIENFDDYFPCRKKRCKLNHVTCWFNVFVDSYNTSMAP
jgi:putative transposase